ncbi:DUF6215 domain-containing protein [Streptomyces sp. NPDC001435]|uniref:DUF6215 domain-containing protein n=1 Tax=unclassified Streptomyces TaxID=2593676 RepID=UPI0036A682A5
MRCSCGVSWSVRRPGRRHGPRHRARPTWVRRKPDLHSHNSVSPQDDHRLGSAARASGANSKPTACSSTHVTSTPTKKQSSKRVSGAQLCTALNRPTL